MAKIISYKDFGKEWISFSKEDVANFKNHEHCPVCGSEKDPETALTIGENKEAAINVVVCKDCSSVYYLNPPSFEYIEDYYANKWKAGEKSTVQEDSTPRPNNKYVNMLKDLFVEDKSVRIMDLGCGNGDNLHGLKNAGFENLWGMEASKHRAEKTNKHFPGRIDCSLYEYYDTVEPFDIVFSNHVIEHTYSPYDAFKWKVANTKDDAIIIMNVPNASFEPVPGQALFLPHLHSITTDAAKIWAKKHDLKMGLWKNARMDDMCLVFVKGNPGFANMNADNFLQADEIQGLNTDEMIQRLRKPWKNVSKKNILITYGQNHKAETDQQKTYGYETISGFYALLFKLLCWTYTFSRKYIGTGFANHLYFFVSRFRKIGGPETLEFRYLEIKPDPENDNQSLSISLKDGKTALMIK